MGIHCWDASRVVMERNIQSDRPWPVQLYCISLITFNAGTLSALEFITVSEEHTVLLDFNSIYPFY